MVVWYRSAAIAGAVFVNEAGKTERMNVEAMLFTFGKGEKDQARTDALAAAAEAVAKAAIAEKGLAELRIWVVGTSLFAPIEPAVSKGLGAYRVGIRVEDGEIVAKADIRYRRSFGAVFDAVLDSVERAKTALWRLFG